MNMPGIPELLVAVSHCIGEAVTIKQADDELGSSAVHSMKYPDYYAPTCHNHLEVALAQCSVLDLVVGYVFLSSLAHATFNLSCTSLSRLLRALMHHGQSWTWLERASTGFCLLPFSRSVSVLPPALSSDSSASQG